MKNKMNRYTIGLLKSIILIMGFAVATLMIISFIYEGQFAMMNAIEGSALAIIMLGILGVVYLSMILFCWILYQLYKLVTYLDFETYFTNSSLSAIRKIRKLIFVICLLYITWLPLLMAFIRIDQDAPGMILLGLIPSVVAFIGYACAFLIEQLLTVVLQMRLENRLTI